MNEMLEKLRKFLKQFTTWPLEEGDKTICGDLENVRADLTRTMGVYFASNIPHALADFTSLLPNLVCLIDGVLVNDPPYQDFQSWLLFWRGPRNLFCGLKHRQTQQDECGDGEQQIEDLDAA